MRSFFALLRRVPCLAVAVSMAVAGFPGASAEGATAPETVAAFGTATPVDVSFGGAPIDIAADPSGSGYWLLNESGEVGAYAGAVHVGDIPSRIAGGGQVGSADFVALAPTPSGGGYVLLDHVGGVHTFGDATFHGSIPGLRAAGQKIGRVHAVDIALTPSGRGYWVLDALGGVFTFGDASFFGSIPGRRAEGQRIGRVHAAALAPTTGGAGYWLLDEAGGVHTFGDATFHGSIPGRRNAGVAIGPARAVDLGSTSSDAGYWVLDEAGGVHTFGDAPFHGSAATQAGAGAGFAPTVAGTGYWVALRQGVEAPPLPGASGSGRRIVYCNSCQRVWLVERGDIVVRSYQVSGRQGVPSPGTYSVFSKSRVSVDASGSLRLDYMTRFAHGQNLAIGFHGIPIHKSSGRPIQTNAELGEFRSHGCVRQAQEDARALWDFAPVGTTVVVTP